MKIAVIGAHGKSGSMVVDEARRRGHEVTAIVQREVETPADHRLVKDVFDLEKADLASFDVVVNALGFPGPEDYPLHSTSLKHIADLLAGGEARLLIVGGAGSLIVDDKDTTLDHTPGFPEAFKATANAMAKALNELRARDDVKWTYVSPAADYRPDGERTDRYAIAGEHFTTNDAGESYLSYADMAQAILDEAETGTHVRERISVYTK